MRKPRHHDGVVYEASGSIYIRHYTTKTVDGQPERVRVSHLLCKVDRKHHSITCKPVLTLARSFMATINATTGSEVGKTPLLITDYWRDIYLPFITKNLKPSTVAGYTQIWEQHLKAHFTERTFQEYETHHGSKLLNDIVAGGYGRRTLAHVRSLASGIFTHVINDGVLKFNPWSEVKTKTKPKAPAPTKAYTLPEFMDIVNNKLTRTDARLVVCLAGLMGLRPCEIVGLDWQDVDLAARKVRVRQAVVRGHVGTTKTDVDESLPMIEPLLGFMKAWHVESDEPSMGWVFPNQSGDPLNIRDYVDAVLRPAIGKESWKTLYAFRRGAASMLTQLTGDPIAASQLLRHKNISVTMTAYIKADRSKLVDGLKLLESKLLSN
jgi:integrase